MRIQKRQQKTDPANLEIVNLAQAKLNLREVNSDQDDNIQLAINQAVQFIEAGLDFAIDTDDTIYQFYDGFGSELNIWHRYISGADDDIVVEYWDGSTWNEVNQTVYRLNSASVPPCIFLRSGQTWPTDVSLDPQDVVRVGFKIDTTHSFYDDIRGAILDYVASKYENAEGTTDVPARVMAVIMKHRLKV